MRLATFEVGGVSSVGVVVGDEVVDLSVAAPDLPNDLVTLLSHGQPALHAAASAAQSAPSGSRRHLEEVSLRSPILRPPKFFAVGLNYAEHVAEANGEPAGDLTVFLKASSCVVGTGASIERPVVSEQLDYEGELGIVIGQRCRHVPKEAAGQVIAGYVIVNDVSVRDWQMKTPQWVLGKSFDTHGVVGPWLTTADEVDPSDLGLRTLVNGEVRQNSSTSYMMWDCATQVAIISKACTLEPGDIIATGTPAGVGGARKPQLWMKAGDTVRVEIDGLGYIENPIVDEVPSESWMVGAHG
jgi:2-keto-4-pentenoate hydratase/2-oxohepta-3-ene-1,7-dioic acid hydratase in catechol pathway